MDQFVILLGQMVGGTEINHKITSSDISALGQNMKRGSSNKKYV